MKKFKHLIILISFHCTYIVLWCSSDKITIWKHKKWS